MLALLIKPPHGSICSWPLDLGLLKTKKRWTKLCVLLLWFPCFTDNCIYHVFSTWRCMHKGLLLGIYFYHLQPLATLDTCHAVLWMGHFVNCQKGLESTCKVYAFNVLLAIKTLVRIFRMNLRVLQRVSWIVHASQIPMSKYQGCQCAHPPKFKKDTSLESCWYEHAVQLPPPPFLQAKPLLEITLLLKNFAPTKVGYTSVLPCQETFDATNGRGSHSGWQLGVHHEKLVTI